MTKVNNEILIQARLTINILMKVNSVFKNDIKVKIELFISFFFLQNLINEI